MNESVLVVLTFVGKVGSLRRTSECYVGVCHVKECIDLHGRIGCLVACSIRRKVSPHTQFITRCCMVFFFPPCVTLSEACVTRRDVEFSFVVSDQSVFRRSSVAPRFPCMWTHCTRQHCCLFMEVLPILLLLRFL